MSIVRAAGRALTRVRNDAPVPLVSRRSSSGGGSALGGGAASATELLGQYGKVSTLFAIVSRTSSAMRPVDWCLYQVPTDGRRDVGEDREPVTTHPAWDLLQYPNPFMSWADIVEQGQQHLDLIGEAMLVVTKSGKVPLELWPIRPDRMVPVPDAAKFLAGWIYRDPDGNKIPLRTDEVIQIKLPNPTDPYRGMGPVQTLLNDLDGVRYSAEWNRNFFINSAEPGGVITIPGHLNDTQWEEFTSRWAEQHKGVGRAHRVAVLEHEATYQPRGYTQRDMQFRELRELGRDVLMEAYGISRATMGITDGVNYAAARAARDQFAELLTIPRLERWKAALNNQLLPMFEPERKPGMRRQATVEFDYDDPREGDPEQDNAERESKATSAQIYITAGFSPSSVQESLGLPDGLEYGTGEEANPDRDLMIQLVTAAPAALAMPLLPLILPNVEGLEDRLEAMKPPPPQLPPGAPPGGDGPPEPPPGGGSGATDQNSRDGEQARLSPGARAGQDGPTSLPSTAAEGAPEVDLTGHAADHEQALERLMDRWDSVRAAWRSELTTQVRDAVDGGRLADLGKLSCDSTHAAEVIAQAREQLAQRSYDRVRDQAAEQDVTLPRWNVYVDAKTFQLVQTPRVLNESDDTADVLAALLAAAEALSAGGEAIRITGPDSTGDQVAGHVGSFLREQEGKAAEGQLSGSLAGAQNAGRIAAYKSGPVASLYADETLDKNTCAPCRAINGRFICTTEDGNAPELDKLYPGMGGYIDCEGRWRCRGTVTGVWRPETTSGNGGDD